MPDVGQAPRGSLLRVRLKGEAGRRWCVLLADNDGLPYDYRGPVGVVPLSVNMPQDEIYPVITPTGDNGLGKQHVYRACTDRLLAIPREYVIDTGKGLIAPQEMARIDELVSVFFLSSKKT